MQGAAAVSKPAANASAISIMSGFLASVAAAVTYSVSSGLPFSTI